MPPPVDRVAICVPIPGEQVCGDGWTIVDRSDGSAMMLVADGLGHGPAAAEAADAAIDVFKKYATSVSPAQMVDAMHLALRPTRGAAVAIALLNPTEQSVRFAGVGNISASIVSPERSQSMVSSNGIVGHQAGRLREFDYAWPHAATMVMHSDGLTSRWSVNTMPGVLSHDLGVLAGSVYRDAARGRDDATVVVVRRADDTTSYRMVPAV